MEFSTISGYFGAIITVLFAVMLIVPILMGAFRGVKKSAFRLVWVVVFSALGFAFMALISNAIVNADITVLNLEVNGTIATTIPQYIELTISASNPDLAQLIADNVEVLKLVVALVVSVINLFIIVIWYWVVKWLLWPAWAIIAHFVFKTKTVKNSKIVKDGHVIAEKQTVVKQKKYAWAGALIGLAMGVISIMFTAIPLAGISDTLIKIEQATATVQADGQKQGILTKNLGENADAIYIYTNSPAGKVLGAVGVNQVSTAMAKVIASVNSNGVKTSALDEVVSIASIANDAQILTETNFEALTKEEWSTTIPKIESVADKVLSMGLLNSVYDTVVPYIIDNMLQDPDYFIKIPESENGILNELVVKLLTELKTIKATDIKNDILIAIDMLNDVNDSNLLTEIIQNNELTLEFFQLNITDQLGTNLNDKLFEMQTASRFLPICIESGVKYLCDELDVTYVQSQTSLTKEQVSQFFDSLVIDGIAILKGFDTENVIQVSPSNFENIGDIADSLIASGIINPATFNNLMDYAIEKINEEIDKTNLKQSVNLLVKSVVADLKNIPSFKTELKHIGNAVQVALDEEIDIENLQIEQAVKVLDKVLPTYVYFNNIDEIEDCVADLINEFILDSNTGITQNTINSVCANISAVNSFELEYAKIKNLVEYVQQILEQNDLQYQLKNTDTMSLLGSHLDATVSSNSMLLTSDNCKLILKDIIKNVELPTELANTKINGQDILVVMANNVDDITSYQTEFVYISNILNIEQCVTLQEYGQALDSVKNSVILNGVIEQIVKDKITENSNSLTDAELVNIVTKVKANVSSVTSYQTEFEYLQQFVNLDPENASMTSFGAMLDDFVDSKLFGNTTNDLLRYALNKGKSQVEDVYLNIYNQVILNVQNINGKVYEQELAYVKSFVDFTNNGEPKTRQNIQQYLDDNILNTNGTSKSILIDNVIVNLILANAII